MTRGPIPIPLEERFWRYVVPEPNSGCWLWDGATNVTGRGYVFGVIRSAPRKNEKASRVSWRLYRGDIPAGAMLCHHCDNSLCVNPEHLYAGDAADNMRDALARKRFPVGEHSPRAKLSADDAIAIRASTKTIAATAREFGVSRAHVRGIRSGQSWRHV